jgi:urease accessory protein
MRRVFAVEPGAAGGATDSVLLDFDRRSRRRIVLSSEAGAAILLDLPRAVHLRNGDVLRLEDGSLVAVRAADEELIEIHGHDSAEMVRIAWHLGNRHLPTQLVPGPDGGTIRIRADHVIAQMVEGLGGHWHAISAPFDPEGGAYGGPSTSHGHSHDGGGHDHGHGHHHEHAHE